VDSKVYDDTIIYYTIGGIEMKKILYLMRHGQTLFNVRRKVQGWCYAPLTELGIKQAETASKYLMEQLVDNL